MINRELFTREDLEKIDALSLSGHYDAIPAAILIDTPQKEHAINLYLLEHRPIKVDPSESLVRKEAAINQSKGKEITDPVEEAVLEEKIQAEKKVLKEKRKKQIEEVREGLKKELEKGKPKT